MPTVVFVCGWLGGKPRAVAKYAAMYHETLGLDTFTLLSTPSDYIQPASRVHAASFRDFQTWLANHHDTTTRLVIIPHLMSNGGCYSWSCFPNHLDRAGIAFDVPCLILDSALSAPRDSSNGPIAFTAAIKNRVVRHICAAILTVLMTVAVFLLSDVFGMEGPLEYNYNRLILRDAAIPKLFLYSRGDSVVNPNHIQDAIAKANELKTPVVQVVDFETSKHVGPCLCRPVCQAQVVSLSYSSCRLSTLLVYNPLVRVHDARRTQFHELVVDDGQFKRRHSSHGHRIGCCGGGGRRLPPP
ncbi:unnamed protein product [Aphanomyces euteiches]